MNLDDRHWRLDYFRQRMTVNEWKKLLLNGQDRIIFNGYMRLLKAKNIGHGVVEVYKEELKLRTEKEGGG